MSDEADDAADDSPTFTATQMVAVVQAAQAIPPKFGFTTTLPDYTITEIASVAAGTEYTVVVRAPEISTYADDYRLLYSVFHQPATGASATTAPNPPISHVPQGAGQNASGGKADYSFTVTFAGYSPATPPTEAILLFTRKMSGKRRVRATQFVEIT